MEFDFPQELNIFLLAIASRPALEPTQPPIEMGAGCSFPGGKAAVV
jgi:hypothetical protein